ncbi:MAG TPA: hypothetical protein VLJ39_08665 [Tepidisphaeraceae bacterium]|nr:hypothetical protein [Tepidisphaeraceae bacterium]
MQSAGIRSAVPVRSTAIVSVLLLTCSVVRAHPQPTDLRDLANHATVEDTSISQAATARLRAAGPEGLAALIDANSQAVRQHREGTASQNDPGWIRVAAAIDSVAAQKDAWASGLYWYTDLDAARVAARQQGKPILSLRLLGTLDSEYSCANSRFFRTVLYANADVSKALSSHFILHWKSVRPVPKVTIDFGDGRVVQRTITGNSIHYVLDPDGNVIDGIPGLYGPKAFLREVNNAAALEQAMVRAKNESRFRELHKWRSNQILALWQSDLKKVGALPNDPPAPPAGTGAGAPGNANPPAAAAAARRAASKAVVEKPLVIALSPDPQVLESSSKDEVWVRIAELHADDARLDQESRMVMATKYPTALGAGATAVAKGRFETPLLRVVHNFERSIALDTVKNEYTFHRQIHEWLAAGRLPDGKSSRDVDALNERVYADLFLTPSSDPWLGLLPPDTYSALPNDGSCLPEVAAAPSAQQTAPITKK